MIWLARNLLLSQQLLNLRILKSELAALKATASKLAAAQNNLSENKPPLQLAKSELEKANACS